MSDTIISRLAGNLSTGRYRILLLELVIVALGVLIGFQVDRWYEGVRDEQRAQEYLQRLLANLESDIERSRRARELAQDRLDITDLLVESLSDDSVIADDPTWYVMGLEQAIYRFNLVTNDATYQELLSTGDMALFAASTRDGLYQYYGDIAEAGQFFGMTEYIQEESFKRFAGILTPELVEPGLMNPDCCLRDRPYTLAEAMAAADRLRNSPAAIQWLGRLRMAHLQSTRQASGFELAAQELHERLSALLGDRP